MQQWLGHAFVNKFEVGRGAARAGRKSGKYSEISAFPRRGILLSISGINSEKAVILFIR
jgi:hypothetical protein